MILLDGNAVSQKILEEVKRRASETEKKLRLAVVVVGNDSVVRSFIAKKKQAGESVGIDVRTYPFPETITTNELRKRIAEIVHEKKNTGVIVQLPLPEHVSKQYILNAVTPEKDVDVLSSRAIGNFVVGKSPILPPIVGAVKTLFEEYGIEYHGKNIVVVGAGTLVGKPIALWLLAEHVPFTIITSETRDAQELLRRADIIITGIGKPGFLTGDMVRDGVVVIDAGTSESEGKIAGDVDFDSVAAKASFVTPVPGGVGPVTVAMLFKNLVVLAQKE